MKKITVSILTSLLMLSMVFSSSVFAANEEKSAWDSFLGLFNVNTSADDVGVEYRGHVQNKGDFPTDGSWIQGPAQLGTVGESLRLEAFWIKLTDAPEGLHIKYEVHVQNIGWMAPVEDGDLAGTQGDALRIEAIKISLVDDAGVVSKDYSVSYKGHVQNQGDTAWFTNGAQLGTTGSGLRLEALEVKIEKIPSDLEAYEAALAAVTEADYTPASWTAYEAIVAANVVTEDNIQSEVDAATAAIVAAQEDLVAIPVISGMTATAQKAITVTGKNLSALTLAQLTVAGNTVTSITPSVDGTTAVVALGTDLAPETDTLVTATIESVATQYTVKYTIAGKAVSIVAGTFDDDTLNQKLTVLVDGVATTPDYLTLAGYVVAFNAWDKDDASANASILGAAAGNATGALSNAVVGTAMPLGTYTAQVTISKGSTIVTSEKATVKILDLNNNTTEIASYVLTNGSTAVMKSSTLVLGETADVTTVTVGYGASASELTAYAGYTVESSNATIISVNSTTGRMTATGIGTCNVTITVGDVTKVIPMTVTGTPRAATKVTPAAASITYIIGGTPVNIMNVTLTDQYGDPMVGIIMDGLDATATKPQVAVPAAVTALTATPAITDTKGVSAVVLGGATTSAQTGAVIFKNTKGATIGSFSVTTTDNSSATIKKLEHAAASLSKDNTINTDLASKLSITYKVGLYNSSGVYNYDLFSMAGYRVMFNKNIISVNADTTGDLTVGAVGTLAVTAAAGGEAGSTTMQTFDDLGNLVDTRIITVTKTAPYITAVAFKTPAVIDYATAINYKNVFNITEAVGDDIVNGITLSSASVFDIRIAGTGTVPVAAPAPILYLDTDDDGIYTGGTDVAIGTLTATISSDATGTILLPLAGTAALDVIVGQNVAATDKGTVTFAVTDTVSTTTPVVNTAGVVVNVK